MGDYFRLLTLSDREIPLADVQRGARVGSVWSVDHPGMLGNYLAIGPVMADLTVLWATVERNPIGPNTLGAEEIAEFLDSLEAGGPPSAVRWLSDYLESVRAIYAIRVYPEAVAENTAAFDAVFGVRTALRDAIGGIGQWDGQGFTNEEDRLIWCDSASNPGGKTAAAILDESTGEFIPFELDLGNLEDRAAFLRGEIPKSGKARHR